MSRIRVWTPTGQLLMKHKNAELVSVPYLPDGVFAEDMPQDGMFAEIDTPTRRYEYFGPVIVERVTEKKEGE